MNIVSIFGSHDGCLTYIKNNKIIFHIQLDRYNKFKHTTYPTKEIIRILENLDIDLFLLSHNRNHTLNIWMGFIFFNKKLKEIPVINYEDRYHHLFHAYCALTWNKNYKNILVCDGNGTLYKNSFEQESYFTFDNTLKHITTESNKIGFKYEQFTRKNFDHELDCGKTMAWSLYDKKPKAIQDAYEKEMTELIDRWQLKDDVIFTGGCAQNVLYNSVLLDRFNNLFCDPFNGDFGLSLGSANFYTNNSIINNKIYLGVPQEINTDLFLKHKIIDVESDDVAKILLEEPVAIFQSRSEQGQRGLGNRSLLMNPIHKDAHSKLNQIKKREWFRPFACSVLKEKAKEWFEMIIDESPYMMYVFKIKKEKENILKAGLSIDSKSRIQTVSKDNNVNYYNLIKSFEKITDIPVLINTSLNLPGDTLVETLDDLKYLFYNSNLNYIYLPEIKKLIKNMSRDLHFPTPIYIFDHKDQSLNIELEKNIINWMKQDEGVQKSNVSGWHSSTDMHQKPEYKRLVDDLFEIQHKIYKEEHLDSEPYLGNMWANVNPPGGYNNAHLHPNSLWSGVYYIKTPENCGQLKINDPRAAASMSRPKHTSEELHKLPIRLWREVNYEPKAGRCIMFPSWLTHCVDINRSNDIRISVSFNFVQKCFVVS